MISLEKLPKINSYADQLSELEAQIEGVMFEGDSCKLGVTYQGYYRDDLREVAKAAILQHLRSRRSNCVASLRQLGVEVP